MKKLNLLGLACFLPAISITATAADYAPFTDDDAAVNQALIANREAEKTVNVVFVNAIDDITSLATSETVLQPVFFDPVLTAAPIADTTAGTNLATALIVASDHAIKGHDTNDPALDANDVTWNDFGLDIGIFRGDAMATTIVLNGDFHQTIASV